MAEKWDGEQKDNDGAAFEVEKPKKEDWHDDWSGKAMVDGSMYWVGIRDMVSAAGKDYKKVRFNPITEDYTAKARSAGTWTGSGGGRVEESKDDIPF